MKKSTWPAFLIPLFLSIYPAMALYSANLEYVSWRNLLRPLLLAVILAGLLYLAALLLFRKAEKAALISAVMLAAIYSYGHVYLAYKQAAQRLIPHSLLAGIYLALAALLIFIILRRKTIPAALSGFLLLALVSANLIALAPTVQHAFQRYAAARKAGPAEPVAAIPARDDAPDIYWIVLDSHTRADILSAVYDYDSRLFLDRLEALGFYTASCSQSNYPTTSYSLSSMMNMGYLQDEAQPGALQPLYMSRVSKFLRQQGYTFYAFENSASSHFELGEDVLLSRLDRQPLAEFTFAGISEFELMLLETTAFRVFTDMPYLLPGVELSQAKYMEHYLQTRYILENLPKVPETAGPRLIVAHILVPHDPYIVTEDGAYDESDQSIPGYRRNTAYIDREILKAIEAILAQVDESPVIILMGDHGPAGEHVTPKMRMSILNSYYVNPAARAMLYPQISPVNTFRMLFSAYFGESYPLLQDKSFFSYNPEELVPEKLIPNPCTLNP